MWFLLSKGMQIIKAYIRYHQMTLEKFYIIYIGFAVHKRLFFPMHTDLEFYFLLIWETDKCISLMWIFWIYLILSNESLTFEWFISHF